MTSLAGRVSAAITVSQKWGKYTFSTLSMSKPALPTPVLTWTLAGSVQQSSPMCSGSRDGGKLGTQFCFPLQSLKRRRNCRDSVISMLASRGDGDGATSVDEECTGAMVQDYNVSIVSAASRSLLDTGSITSIIVTLVLCGLHWGMEMFCKSQGINTDLDFSLLLCTS